MSDKEEQSQSDSPEAGGLKATSSTQGGTSIPSGTYRDFNGRGYATQVTTRGSTTIVQHGKTSYQPNQPSPSYATQGRYEPSAPKRHDPRYSSKPIVLYGSTSGPSEETQISLQSGKAIVSQPGVNSSQVDSGYGSSRQTNEASKVGYNAAPDDDDKYSLYSIDSLSPTSSDRYIYETTRRLADDIRHLMTVSEPLKLGYPTALSALLKSFARRLHGEAESRAERETSVFLHRHRRWVIPGGGGILANSNVSIRMIVKSLGVMPANEDSEHGEDNQSHNELEDNLPFQKPEKDVVDWLGSIVTDASPDSKALPSQDNEPSELLNMTEYQNFVGQSKAYGWLLSMITIFWRLSIPGVPDAMAEIRDMISLCITSQISVRKVSRQTRQATVDMKTSLDWDLRQFIADQRYDVKPAEILDSAICLTGIWQQAQADTPRSYMERTWPLTYRPLYDLVKEFLSPNEETTCTRTSYDEFYVLTSDFG